MRDRAPRIHPSARLKDTRLGRATDIAERVVLRDVTVGDYSYFERGGEAVHADIGRFCSIAAQVRINALQHPLDRLTTHKISYRANEYFRFQALDQETRTSRAADRVRIGHDVWIGHGAVIMPGMSIGHGAVVGANAVVTHDVEAHMIVAGVPARPLRSRFEEDISRRILALEWWDWDDDTLFEAIPDMRALDIGAFLDKWERRR